MKFTLIKNEHKGTVIPHTVIENLYDARSNDLKVILYAVHNDCFDPLKISSDLGISHSAAVSSLHYWADAGLIRCEEEVEVKSSKKHSLTSEIIASFSHDPGVQALSKNLQLIFAGSLSEKYTNKFISLYLEEAIPVDVILQITQHHLSIGMDNPAYIIKVVRSWFTKYKLTSGSEVDKHLALCKQREQNYKKVCDIFKLDIEKLKTSEKTIINKWFENLNMNPEMIEESCLRAGNQQSIVYCNGILKSWSQKGYRSPKDLGDEIVNLTQSVRNIDSQEDLLVQNMSKVPVFNKNNKRKM